ncbi:MAG: cupin domain-containing protein [Candidatus Eremiobacteraeota bacterium]|nr:cupin domain-containing protein [Candidatus Eremiobacteraeota bacterium]
MVKRLVSFIGAIALVSAAAAAANGPTIVMPSQLQWKAMAGFPGAMVAVVSGNPTKAGSDYVERYKMPDGMKIPPHFHPAVENVTVLQGTLMVGLGDKMDAAKMVALPAGSFVSVPMNLHHYAMAKGVTIIQIHGIGPDTIEPVKAAKM